MLHGLRDHNPYPYVFSAFWLVLESSTFRHKIGKCDFKAYFRSYLRNSGYIRKILEKPSVVSSHQLAPERLPHALRGTQYLLNQHIKYGVSAQVLLRICFCWDETLAGLSLAIFRYKAGFRDGVALTKEIQEKDYDTNK